MINKYLNSYAGKDPVFTWGVKDNVLNSRLSPFLGGGDDPWRRGVIG
jgi:hypothetical protein